MADKNPLARYRQINLVTDIRDAVEKNFPGAEVTFEVIAFFENAYAIRSDMIAGLPAAEFHRRVAINEKFVADRERATFREHKLEQTPCAPKNEEE